LAQTHDSDLLLEEVLRLGLSHRGPKSERFESGCRNPKNHPVVEAALGGEPPRLDDSSMDNLLRRLNLFLSRVARHGRTIAGYTASGTDRARVSACPSGASITRLAAALDRIANLLERLRSGKAHSEAFVVQQHAEPFDGVSITKLPQTLRRLVSAP
jgi:hypothetical protein